MFARLMVLPNRDPTRIRLVTIPEDLGPQEAYRMVTGLTAEVEETAGPDGLADVLEALEARGFDPVDFVLGPALD
jgi:hypothetical protein